ncbi:Metazoan SpoT homolog-1 [Carabus blaptoides fortunei]
MNFNISASGITEIIRCINFAAIKHRKQRRKDYAQTPYINHPIGVAYILTEEAKITDGDVIQAAILHDTVEDTDTSFEEIESVFGTKIRNIVEEVTDDKNLAKEERKRLQIVHAPTSSTVRLVIKTGTGIFCMEQESYRWITWN